MSYVFLPDIATADVAFRAWGASLPEVFIAAAQATLNVMVENPAAVVRHDERQVSLTSESRDMLLFKFLQELIYFKDADNLLLTVGDIHIDEDGALFYLRACLRGEAIDSSRHQLSTDIKAVTLHLFSLKSAPAGWEARVVLDI